MDARISPARIVLIGAVMLLTVVYQLKVLEPTPEIQNERRYSDLSKLPTGSALLTYVGTLLTGPARGLAITWLWVRYDELANTDRKYMEAIDYLKLIVKLNPRNPEAWAALAHDLCYNLEAVAPLQMRWPLYKEGLLLLREGIKANPTSGYLMHELGWKMLHKVSWQQGWFDEELIHKITNDDELQNGLRVDGKWDGIRRTPFMLAKPWFKEARDILDDEMKLKKREAIYTQMGLLMSPSLMDMYIMYCDYRQAMYEWYPPRRRHDDALAHLQDATAQVEVIRRRYGDWISLIYEKRRELFDQIKDVILLDKLTPREPGAQDPPQAHAAFEAHLGQLLRQMEAALLEFESLDEGFVYTFARSIKRRLTRDSGELDDFLFCARWIGAPKDRPVEMPANLSPAGRDLDVIVLGAPPTTDENPPPASAGLDIANNAGIPIHAKIVALNKGQFEPLAEAIVQPHETRNFSDVPIDYKKTVYLMISAARLPDSPTDPLPYLIRRLK